MTQERENLILASLFHDIGKFYQSTKPKKKGEKVYPDNYNESEYNSSLNLAKYDHAVWSEAFLKTITTNREILNLVLKHHKPDETKYLELIILLADWLSSGERRISADNYEGDEIERGIFETPLKSIFSNILSGKNKKRYYYDAIKFPPDDYSNLIPKPDVKLASEDYNRLWMNFKKEIEQNFKEGQDFEKRLKRIKLILKKYTYFIPSSKVHEPEIPLFMHLKNTSLLADVIYKYTENMKEETRLEYLKNIKENLLNYFKFKQNRFLENLSETPFLLVKGDISGIQNFIYNIYSKNVIKSLKGRSFFIQLISDVIAHKIVHECGLYPELNIVVSNGGNFYLLLSNTDEVKSKIETLKSEIVSDFIKAFNTELSLVISEIELPISSFLVKEIGNLETTELKEYFNKLGKKLEVEKRRLFSKEMTERFDKIQRNISPENLNQICSSCGRSILRNSYIETEDREKICLLCDSFVELGHKLRNKELIRYNRVEKYSNTQNVTYKSFFKKLGYEVIFSDNEIEGDWFSINKSHDKFPTVFIARHFPIGKDETAKSLDEISNGDGIKKWGILKGDIDFLGKVFKDKLVPYTFSSFTTLSEFLGLFFSYVIEKISLEKDFKDNIYIIYSGGDDFVILGQWNILIKFVIKLRKIFAKYTCGNLTFSAGLYFAPSKKFSVLRAIEEAEHQETEAKKLSPDKNRLSIFDKVIEWEKLTGDFNDLEDESKLDIIKNKLIDIVSETKERSIIRILSSYLLKNKKVLHKDDFFEPIWYLIYQIARFKKDKKNEIKNIIDELKSLIIKDYAAVNNLEIAVRWADYLTRKGGE